MKRKSLLLLGGLVGVLGVSLATASGCSGDSSSSGDTEGAGAAGQGGTGAAGQGGDLGLTTSSSGTGIDPEEACAAQSAEATLVKRPVDVIFIIDNSGSMGNEIESVQNNINDNFAAIIGAEGVDYRVIMLSEHGAVGDESICVSMPLSSTACDPVPDQPGNNDPVFFHYSTPIASHDSLCRALRSYSGTVADQYGYAPGGWSEWLRQDSLKVFVEITDDGVSCNANINGNTVQLNDNDNEAGGITAAERFDTALLGLSPEHFGTVDQRNYVFYSIVGLAENDPMDAPYAPADPMVLGQCNTAVAPGSAYQALSRTTGGLRFPLCQTASYNVVFQAIAEGVIQGATLACDFAVPEAPVGETIDLATVEVQYTPSAGDAQVFTQVGSAAECAAGSFYIEAETTIHLCPDACTVVQADAAAKIDVLFACTITPD